MLAKILMLILPIIALHDDSRKGDFPTMAQSLDYPVETHHVTTPDGYILTLHRIYGPKGEYAYKNRPPLLYYYGILDSVDTIISNDEQYSGGYVLANLGYDMWFVSLRGSKYSSHEFLKPKDKYYWDYSFDEFALFDIPTTIDYVINVTHYQKVAVIAHSQGTLSMFASLIIKSDVIGSKVSAFAALSPVFRITNLAINDVVKYLFLQSNIIESLEDVSIYKILTRTKYMEAILGTICKYFPTVCQWGTDLVCSAVVPPNDNLASYKYLAYHMPNSFTTKNIKHFKQLYYTGTRMYDYGTTQNKKLYGTMEAPYYNLSLIAKVPIGLFREKYDRFTTDKDYLYLSEQLHEAGVLEYEGEYDGGHISLFTGKNITIFIDAAAFISKYHPWSGKKLDK